MYLIDFRKSRRHAVDRLLLIGLRQFPIFYIQPFAVSKGVDEDTVFYSIAILSTLTTAITKPEADDNVPFQMDLA